MRIQYESTAASAERGNLEALNALPSITSAMLKAEQEMASSSLMYTLAVRETAADLKLTGAAGKAAADAEALRIAQFFANFYSSAAPQYAVGTPFVPNDQLAVVHKGEAIIPAAHNPYARSKSATVSASTNSDTRAEAVATMSMLNQVLKMMQKWDFDGMPERRESYVSGQ